MAITKRSFNATEVRAELAFMRYRFCKPVSNMELSRITGVEPATVRRIIKRTEAVAQAGLEIPETWKETRELALTLQ